MMWEPGDPEAWKCPDGYMAALERLRAAEREVGHARQAFEQLAEAAREASDEISFFGPRSVHPVHTCLLSRF